MKKIKIEGSDQVALVDNEDYERVLKHTWIIKSKHKYIVRKSDWLGLHQFVMNSKEGEYVDHINHILFDNRKDNLRICTNSQNLANMLPHKGGTSKYKGVTSYKDRWVAQITVMYKHLHLGIFKSEKLAARHYDKCSKHYFGEYAHLNFPDLDNSDLRVRHVDYDQIEIKRPKDKKILTKKEKLERKYRRNKVFIKKKDGKLITCITLHGEKGEGKLAYTDLKYFGLVRKYKWYLRNEIPEASKFGLNNELLLDKIVFGEIPKGKLIYHKDNNSLNCFKENLTLITIGQRQALSSKIRGVSKYKGVRLTKEGSWRATLEKNGKQYNLGCYANEIDAALAFDKGSLYYHGELCFTNFPKDTPKDHIKIKGIDPDYERPRRTRTKVVKGSSSKFLNVSFHKSKKTWEVYINGKYITSSPSEKVAACIADYTLFLLKETDTRRYNFYEAFKERLDCDLKKEIKSIVIKKFQ